MRSREGEQEDYLLRLIRQAGEALRQLKNRLLHGAGSPEVVRLDASTAIEALLGPQARVLGMLDPVSAVRLVGRADQVALWAALLSVEADATAGTGDAPGATRLHERARALRDAARSVWGGDIQPPESAADLTDGGKR